MSYENRFLIDFNLTEFDRENYDVVIIGSGIAGLYTALQLPETLRILIVAKEDVDNSNTALAQGGIAVSLGFEDSPQMHFDDTIFAGAGLCDEDAVWVLVNEARENVENLLEYGVIFDKDSLDRLSLTREGAHSINRIIHAGDTTGKAVLDVLCEQVLNRKNIEILTRYFAVDLLTLGERCEGLIIFDMDRKIFRAAIAPVVVCATGGYGQIYKTTTNPDVSTGDGVALAFRCGAELADVEFVQFHPTVLYHQDKPGFLISEALRGEGAVLRNHLGERFMEKYHQLLDLAPRDIVARAMFKEIENSEFSFVYLDITHKEKEYLKNRFPNIFATLLEIGIDMSVDLIPVAPAEHYSMGGIKTDIAGRTTISGFYACGECASNGIHGANRLASNSLLEGMVFGRLIARDIVESRVCVNDERNVDILYDGKRKILDIDCCALIEQLKILMTSYVGIERDANGLKLVQSKIYEFLELINNQSSNTLQTMELANMLTVACLVVESAIMRQESRGAHFRNDYPKKNDEIWRVHIVNNKNGRYIISEN